MSKEVIGSAWILEDGRMVFLNKDTNPDDVDIEKLRVVNELPEQKEFERMFMEEEFVMSKEFSDRLMAAIHKKQE